MNIDGLYTSMVQYRQNLGKGVLPMPKTEAQQRAERKYQAKMRQIKVWLDPVADADIIERLDKVPNKVQYIRYLVRKDLESGSK